MNSTLERLYRQTLLEHSKKPRNNQALPGGRKATVHNPLCGDEITVYLKSGDTNLEQIAFTSQSCSICTASASMMSETLATKPISQAKSIAEDFVSGFKDKASAPKLEGDLAALLGILEFPSRIRCATLPWEAFLLALESKP